MSHEALGAQLISLPALFEGRFFVIPDYQRSYAWGVTQVTELLKDIDHLLLLSLPGQDKLVKHYTGTLVLSQLQNEQTLEYHVVDGQQRLTTLVLLLSELAKHTPETQRHVFKARYIQRGEVGNERFVLQLNQETRAFFEAMVTGKDDVLKSEPILQSHDKLLEAKKTISLWLAKHALSNNDIHLKKLQTVVEEKLGFLIYAPVNEAEIGVMFEVINNRGKPLSELEKVKNYIVYCCAKLQASTLREQTNQTWAKLLKNLNLADKTSPAEEGAFLRYCMVVHFGLNKTDSQNAYDELKQRWDEKVLNLADKDKAVKVIREFVHFLEQASYWYAKLFSADPSGLDPAVQKILELLGVQSQHASIMPLFLALVIKNTGTGEALVRLLKLLEIINFRVYTARNMIKRNDSGQGRLYDLAASYYQGKLLELNELGLVMLGNQKIATQEQGLEYMLTQFVLRHASDQWFEDSFTLETDNQVDDFYHWAGLQYFLINYEVSLQPHKTIPIRKIKQKRKEGKSADFYSKEHIWATNNRVAEGENDRAIDYFQKRRLGNFCLLEFRLNIQGSKLGIDEKIIKYTKHAEESPTDFKHVRKMIKDAETVIKQMSGQKQTKNYFNELYSTICDLQEQRYIKFAAERWSVKDYFGYKQLIKSLASEQADED